MVAIKYNWPLLVENINSVMHYVLLPGVYRVIITNVRFGQLYCVNVPFFLQKGN